MKELLRESNEVNCQIIDDFSDDDQVPVMPRYNSSSSKATAIEGTTSKVTEESSCCQVIKSVRLIPMCCVVGHFKHVVSCPPRSFKMGTRKFNVGGNPAMDYCIPFREG